MEDNKYVDEFRMNKATFWQLYRTYGQRLQRQDTRLRKAWTGPKRFAIFLDWHASGSTYTKLASRCNVSKASVNDILHEAVALFKGRFVRDHVKFPSSNEPLAVTLEGFQNLCDLPYCMGALDGPFF